ncbi:MAG: DUF418 domain-containing protein [Prevotellaceae bacterium]|jgi:uncharacterized protein|nr:DUF418 domain-containing protein [Prevotellaceae bacterium]
MNTQPHSRVDIADVLRGFAVMGIILLHSIEHFNYYFFPETFPFEWMKFTDTAIWDGMFFAFSGKAYAVFALLFGFSFYIQDDNQRRRGKDFRLRFLWRLMWLFLIGQVNACFFTGEILTMYAVLGLILPLCCRLNNRALLIIAIILLIQPIDLANLFYGLVSPERPMGRSLGDYYFGLAYQVQGTGSFLETVRMNLTVGQLANFWWSFEHGRLTQTAGLFLLGLWIGRKELFVWSENYENSWLKTLGYSLVAFFPLYGLYLMIPDFVTTTSIQQPLTQWLYAMKNLSFTAMLVSGLWMVFYRVKDRTFLMRFAPYGKMSMTNYLWQSIMGSALFYHWGLNLGVYMTKTYSFLFGIAFVLLQLWFCTWWLRHHSHGIFEGFWRKMTWLGSGRS